MHDGDGAVGATDLLQGSQGAVLLTDLSAGISQVADFVESVLADEALLSSTAVAAARVARSWDEEANALQLVRFVEEAMGRAAPLQ